MNLACQVASLEVSIVRGEQALMQTKSELREEHSHRQDLQHKVVERDRKISTLEKENMKLLFDRRELDAQKKTLQMKLEPQLTAEKQAKEKENEMKKQLDAALLQERHFRV